MRRGIFIRVLPVLAAAVMLSAALASAACNAGAATPPDKEPPEMDLLHSIMSFIGQHHAETAPFIKADAAYTQTSSSGKGMLGYSSVTYSGGGWTVTVGHAVVPDYVNEITADYGNGKITWTGTEKNGQVTEASYTKTG